MYSEKEYSRYFSGAGYLITGSLALQMAQKVNEVPLMPLDDCFIGSVINYIGKKRALKYLYLKYIILLIFYRLKLTHKM